MISRYWTKERTLKSIFSRHGIPNRLISDNGTQYACEEFRKFAESYKSIHTTSSPRYTKGNGIAERAIQTVKKLLKKYEDPYLSMLDYRSIPLEVGLSPAKLLMHRNVRSILPSIGGRKITKIGEHIQYQEWQEEKIKKGEGKI